MTDLEAEVRRHLSSLTIALRLRDDAAALIAAVRLRRATDRDPAAITEPIAGIAQLLLQAAPVRAPIEHRDRVERWAARIEHGGPDLFELDAVSRDLGLARFSELHVASCVFWSGSLVGATFDRARLERCDFGRANLERTAWRAARVIECNLAGAALVDAMLDDATFVDCDLRGADLGVVRRGGFASTARTMFVRCDLRETHWARRDLARAELIDCKMHGAYGLPA